jgi:hypothetical protein
MSHKYHYYGLNLSVNYAVIRLVLCLYRMILMQCHERINGISTISFKLITGLPVKCRIRNRQVETRLYTSYYILAKNVLRYSFVKP